MCTWTSIRTESRFFAGHEGRTYPITGPAAVTRAEIAAAIGAAVGRELTFVDAPPEVLATALRGVLPDWQVEGLLEDVATFARDHAAAFGG